MIIYKANLGIPERDCGTEYVERASTGFAPKHSVDIFNMFYLKSGKCCYLWLVCLFTSMEMVELGETYRLPLKEVQMCPFLVSSY